MRQGLRAVATFFVRMLPPGAAEFIYRSLLATPPLRRVTNAALVALVPERIRIPEGELYLNPKDPVISSALAFGIYEPFETEVFRSLIGSGMTVIDIGANIGYHTLIAAARVEATGRVIAFEPEPENFGYLTKNIEHAHATNVRAYEIAIADRAGHSDLHLSNANKGKHSMVTGQEHSAEFTETVSIQTETLDEALTAEAVTSVDIIKMDIEGAEPLALAGMQRTLEQFHPLLFIEFSPEAIRRAGSEPEQMLTTLTGFGYRLFEMEEHIQSLVSIHDRAAFASRFTGDAYANILCIPDDARARLVQSRFRMT